jgi:hypothetical protein
VGSLIADVVPIRCIAVVALCLAGVAGAGCGGDEGEATLSAEELTARADEVCAAAAKRFAEAQSRPPATPKRAEAQTAELIALSGTELADLRELSPPEDLAQPYEAYLAARERLLDLLERGREAAAAGDEAAYTEAQTRAIAGQTRRASLARAAGLKECSAKG